MSRPTHPQAEVIARRFHAAYEWLSPSFGYRTRTESAKPWAEVPKQNRDLMIATVDELLRNGVILPGMGAAR